MGLRVSMSNDGRVGGVKQSFCWVYRHYVGLPSFFSLGFYHHFVEYYDHLVRFCNHKYSNFVGFFNNAVGFFNIFFLDNILFSTCVYYVPLIISPVLFNIKIDGFLDSHPKVANRAFQAENLFVDRWFSFSCGRIWRIYYLS